MYIINEHYGIVVIELHAFLLCRNIWSPDSVNHWQFTITVSYSHSPSHQTALPCLSFWHVSQSQSLPSHNCSSSNSTFCPLYWPFFRAVALDPSAMGLPSLDPRVCLSAQFLLHGSPPSPARCLFIAQLSLFSLHCILGKKEEERTEREGERERVMDKSRGKIRGATTREGGCKMQ